ncbi:MAG TPA: ATP-binding protein, partial [Armatimonadota bacterium]|nr:ATP-binding protein [Armatimonadota bacterium]
PVNLLVGSVHRGDGVFDIFTLEDEHAYRQALQDCRQPDAFGFFTHSGFFHLPLDPAVRSAAAKAQRVVLYWCNEYAQPILARSPERAGQTSNAFLLAMERAYMDGWRARQQLQTAVGREHVRYESKVARIRTTGMLFIAFTGMLAILVIIQGLRGEQQVEEARLREETERIRLATILQSLPVGVLILEGENIENAVATVNAAYQEIHRVEVTAAPAHVQDLPSLSIYYRPDRETPVPLEALPSVRAAFTGEETQEKEFHLRHTDGSWSVVLDTAVPIRDSRGKLLGSVAVLQDVTEFKRVEQELMAANEEKDRFLATLSHELRNPLAPIQSSVEILRRGAADPERVRRIAEVIDRNVKLQARLVNDLLDLARITRGKVQLHRQVVALNTIVERALETVRPSAAGISLGCTCPPNIWVDGDPIRLQQVVMNLLANSIKFTPAGGNVQVDLVTVDNKARVIVTDTGIGISKEMLPHLFEMFRQGEVAAAGKQGLGIGLALVQSLTELHGGSVWAESAGPGKGSRFTVELPLAAPPEKEEKPGMASHQGTQPNILLVEDNADARETLAMALEMMDYQVESVETPRAALDAVRATLPDAILCDIGLPEMDGYELMRQLRALPGMEKVPAFALTGYGQPEDVAKAHEVGFDAHFTKPVDLDELDRCLREAIKQER